MTPPLWVEGLGAIAGFCTTFAFVPQLVKIYRQGGRDLSYVVRVQGVIRPGMKVQVIEDD